MFWKNCSLQISGENTYVAGPQACNFIKKILQHKCFPINFLRIPLSTEQLQWLFFKIRNGNLWIAIQTCFNDISYAKPISDDLELSQWQTNLKMQSLAKILFRYSIFVADLEQTPIFLKSDRNSNNFGVLLHFWKTCMFGEI